MTVRLIVGIAIGMGLGAVMGHFGKCSSGACPLTANPYRGAIYGGVLGALFTLSLAGSVKPGEGVSHPDSVDTGKRAAGEPSVSDVVQVASAEEFERHVANATQPCLADFSSDRCSPCRVLGKTIEGLAGEYRGRAVVCKVSLDAAPELAQRHQVMVIPTVLFFDHGAEVQRLVGLQPRFAYGRVLASMITEHDKSAEDIPNADL